MLLIVVQRVFVDVMQVSSDIMPFWPVKTPVFDSPPGFAAFEGLFGLLRYPSNQDILDNIEVIVEVLALREMMEGGFARSGRGI